jgi:cell division protein FtsB
MRKREKITQSFKKKLIIGGLAFLSLVLFIASFFGKSGLLEIHKANQKRKNLQAEIHHLIQRKTALEREIQELENNPRAVEKTAREKLWLVKPDEIIIIRK